MMLKRRIGVILQLIFVFISFQTVFAQDYRTIKGDPVDIQLYKDLSAQFHEYQIVEWPITELDALVQSENFSYRLELLVDGGQRWDISLFPHDIKGRNYQLRSSSGIKTSEKVVSFLGHLGKGGRSEVRLVIDKEYLGGLIIEGDETWFIEPLFRYQKGVDRDLFLLYKESKVVPRDDIGCLALETEEFRNRTIDHKEETLPGQPEVQGLAMMQCYEVEVATAHDKYMFDKYGSVSACESHALAVMNNVATNWDDEFADEIQMFISEQFVEENNINWPTSSTNAGTVLSSFRNWANGGGFSGPYDVGQLWTDRDFNGGTVGIAYLSSVCSGSRYHALQDFTNNSSLLRVLTSHELGHNFSCTHDSPSSPTIMAPSVNNTNQWSNQSISQVNNFVPNAGCLASCATVQPPVADFSADVTMGCAPMTVQFTDQSSGGAATSWNWTFPGGIPSSSTQQNPTVTYNSGGFFDVTLTVSNNGGSDTRTKSNYIQVDEPPISDFTYFDNQLFVTFTSASVGADILTWDFGDGSVPISGMPGQSIPGGTHQGKTTGTYDNPTHEYDIDGTYVVTLTADNNCGTDVFQQAVTVVSPVTANFTSNTTTGCADLVVEFESLASPNTTQWFWEFPGGTPATSTLENPTVTYGTEGNYDVILEVSNSGYVDRIERTAYITVLDKPVAGFSHQVNNLTVNFTNTTQNSNSFSWDFGDGSSSNAQNPSHTYAADGIYTVTLIANNTCGQDTFMLDIEVGSLPSANFTSDITEGCEPLTVSFEDISSANTTSWEWEFEGGVPATSTIPNPVVDYNSPGSFTVTLIATNGLGSDTLTRIDYITVNPEPEALFSEVVNNEVVDFQNLSNYGDSYLWEFGDGETSDLENPVHTYDQDGDYTVRLTVENDCGIDIYEKVITIATPPSASFTQDVTEGCEPLTVNFENLSSNNATDFEWTFEGGTPGTSTDENPTVIFSSDGEYDVTLIAFNAQGSDTVMLTDHILVNPLPEALFNNVIDSNVVEFENLSEDSDSYSWEFGDGETSDLENPVHTYDQDGDYTVKLTVENDCGMDMYEKIITIATFPSANFTQDVTSGCAPFTVSFENLSSENTTQFEWTFEGGIPGSSNAENPVIEYNTAGSFDVTLIATNNQGSDTLTMSELIVVNDVPVADYSYNQNDQIIEFLNASVRGDSYSWDFGDGNTSMEENPFHEYDENGDYEVWLWVENECGIDSVQQIVGINAYPVAAFTSDTTSGCRGQQVQFSSLAEQADSLSWEFEGGDPESSTDTNPLVTYNESGFYVVTLIAINNLGADTISVVNYIEIFPDVESDFSFAVNGYLVDFENTSQHADSYSWDFGDGNTSTEEDPEHEYADEGVYTVQLIAEGLCGIDTVNYTVEIIDRSPVISIATNANSGCAPLTISYMDLSTNDPTSWLWEFEGGNPATSTDQNPVVTYEESGIYSVTLEVTNQFGTSKAVYDSLITVLPDPESDFSIAQTADTIQLTNLSENYNRIFWDFGDGNTSSEEDPQHVYEENGTYQVMLIVFNDCGSDTSTQQVTVSVSGIYLPEELGDFNIFPNPNNGVFTVVLSDQKIQDEIAIEVSDLLGRMVLSRKADASLLRDGILLDIPGQNSGTYIVTLRQGSRVSVTRVAVFK